MYIYNTTNVRVLPLTNSPWPLICTLFWHCSVSISQIRLHDINTLRGKFPSSGLCNQVSSSAASYNKIIGEEDCIINDIVRKHNGNGCTDAFVRAGPRSTTHFNPKKVRAAIVTCGGLCPGLNSVIRELVHALVFLYDAESVLGIRYVQLSFILFCKLHISFFCYLFYFHCIEALFSCTSSAFYICDSHYFIFFPYFWYFIISQRRFFWIFWEWRIWAYPTDSRKSRWYSPFWR